MSLGRQIADAYIEVHGDLAPFRRDLESKGRKAAQQAGAENAKSFGQRFNEVLGNDRVQGIHDMFDNIARGSDSGWDRMFQGFGLNLDKAKRELGNLDGDDKSLNAMLKNLDDGFENAKRSLNELFESAKDAGKLLDMDEDGSVLKDNTQAVRMELDRVINRRKDEIQLIQDAAQYTHGITQANKRLDEQTRRYGQTLEGLTEQAGFKQLRSDTDKLTKALANADFSAWGKGFKDVDKFEETVRRVIDHHEKLGNAQKPMVERAKALLSTYLSQTRELQAQEQNQKKMADWSRQINQGMQRSASVAREVAKAQREQVDAWTEIENKVAKSDIDKKLKDVARVVNSGDWEKFGKTFGGSMVKARRDTINLLKEMQRTGDISEDAINRIGDAFGDYGRRYKFASDTIKRDSKATSESMRDFFGVASRYVGNAFAKTAKRVATSFGKMDRTVQFVLKAILVAAGPIATMLSGISASLTAVVSSLGMALASAVPLATAFGGMALGVSLMVGAMDEMKAQFPGIEEGVRKISAAWQDQIDSFATQMGPALDGFLNTFGEKLGSVDFGAPMGAAMGQVIAAFEGILVSPGFSALLEALETTIPAAVQGFGEGFAGVMNAVVNLMAGAAPVAQELGELFSKWGGNLGEVAEAARESGEMNKVFELAKESLVAILDFTGSVGNALGNLFMIGADTGNSLLGALTGVVDKFNEWIQTDAGRATLLEWFENGERIIKGFEPLVVGLADALGRMVTPQLIEETLGLLESLGGLLPVVGSLLAIISEANVIGILAELFNIVGQAVTPLLPALSEMAIMIGETVMSSVQALAPVFITLVSALTPVIESIAKLAGELLPIITPLFAQMGETLQPIIQVLATLVGWLADMLVPILMTVLPPAVEFLVSALSTGFTIIQTVFEALYGFFTETLPQIITAITEWGAGALETITTTWTAVKDFFIGLWEGISTTVTEVLTNIATFLTDTWTNISTFFTETWTNIATFFTETWTAISEFFTTIWEGIMSVVGPIVEGLGLIIVGIFEGVGAFLRGMLDGLLEAFGTSWTEISAVVTTVVTVLKGIIESVWANIKTKTENVFNAIKDFFTDVWNNIKSTVEGVLNAVRDFITDTWNNIKSAIESVLNPIRDFIADTWNSISSTVTDVLNSIRSTISAVWNAIKATIGGVLSGIWSGISSRFNAIRATISGVMNAVSGILSGAWNFIKSVFSTAMSLIGSSVSNGFSNLKAIISNFPQVVKSFFSGFPTLLYSAGRDLIQGLINGIGAMGNAIWSAAQNIAKRAVSAIKGFFGIASPSKLMTKFGHYIGEGLVIGVDGEQRAVADSMKHLGESALGGLNTDDYLSAGISAAEAFANGIGSVRTPSLSADVLDGSTRRYAGGGFAGESDTPKQSGGTTIEAGAIQVNTPAQDAKIVAEETLDALARAL